MATAMDVQRALIARGFDIGRSGADGDIGPATLGAILRALQKLPLTSEQPPLSSPGPVPAAWMPWARMQRIIVHWTAGAHKASGLDKAHYHILIEGDGKLVRGTPTIDLNQSPVKTGYAAHTLNCNSGSIGVSLCAMAGAVESPFDRGDSPITPKQWEVLPTVLADLCRRYAIPVTPATLLSHAEVQGTLGIKQRGKWDIRWRPGSVGVQPAKTVGDEFRAATKALL